MPRFMMTPLARLAAITAAGAISSKYANVGDTALTKTFKGEFADARRGFVFASLRTNLLRLAQMEEDSKNWRPTVLVFSGNPTSRELLVSYGIWIEANRGVVILGSIITGDLTKNAKRIQEARAAASASARPRRHHQNEDLHFRYQCLYRHRHPD